MREALRQLGVLPPDLPTLPDALSPFTGRCVWTTTLADIRREAPFPIFLKPAVARKEFGGVLARGFADLVATAALTDHFAVLASEPVVFVAEHRCFVLRGEVIGCRPYKGDPLVFPDPKRIRDAVAAWPAAPRAWALDVGVVASGETFVVEVNDARSLGDYGLAIALRAPDRGALVRAHRRNSDPVASIASTSRRCPALQRNTAPAPALAPCRRRGSS